MHAPMLRTLPQITYATRPLVLALAVTLAACGGGDSPSTPNPDPEPNPNEVGSGGGTVTAQSGKVRLSIPAGALSSNVTISVTAASDPASDPNVVAGTVYEFGPDGTQFSQPVTLTLDYDPSAVPAGIPPEAVTIVKYTGGTWQPITGTVSVDPVNGKVSGQITSFSRYSVQADRCALRTLALEVTGSISDADCAYSDASRTTWEEFYAVDPGALASAAGVDAGSAPLLVVTVDADFDVLIGFQEAGEGSDGLVYDFSQVDVDASTGRATTSFSVIAPASSYRLFIGGNDVSDTGDFTLTTSVRPTGTWDPSLNTAHVIAGSATFAGAIDGASSLQGTINVGPASGQPLQYQYWLAKLEAGTSYRFALEDIAGTNLAAFVSATPLSTGVDSELDVPASDADREREIVFTASVDGYYYLEASGSPTANAGYTLVLEEVSGFDPCAARELAPSQTSTINASDCLYTGGTQDQYEEFYAMPAASFAASQGVSSGPALFNFTVDAAFDGILGFKAPGDGGLVFGSRTFTANTSRSMSVIADGGDFEVFVGGSSTSQTGRYTMGVATSAIGNYRCGASFLATAVTFNATLTDTNGCEGTINFGPNVGNPLIYQYWYAKLEAGKTYTISVTGASNGTTALFVSNADFQTEQTLDLASDGNDTDRSITFTPQATTYYYFEVSKAPGGSAPYSFSFREGS